MDYTKIVGDLNNRSVLVDDALRDAAAVAIVQTLRENLSLRTELQQAKRNLELNEAAVLEIVGKAEARDKREEALRKEVRSLQAKSKALTKMTMAFPFVPGVKYTTSVEDPDTMYLDMPDGLRLVFHEGKYTGYVAEVGKE